MTNVFKYVKIIGMKTHELFKIKFLLILVLALTLVASAVGLISVSKTKAATTTESQLLLPSSNLEYLTLSSPVDAYSDQDITAILQEGKLIIYQNGSYQIITDSILEQAKQLNKLNDTTLLLSSGTITREVDLTASPVTVSTFELNSQPIGSTFFDFNSKYLVTTAGTTAKTYTFDGSAIANNDNKIVNIATDSPIAINDNDEIFFVKENWLQKHKIGSSDFTMLKEISPSKIIANNQHVYYLLGSTVYRIPVNGGETEELSSPTSNFQLGKISNPQSISFKGDNLLITGDNAVQEFRVKEDNSLEFTGFAVARGQTAYNRISSTVKEIEREKDVVATLDGDKFSLINVPNAFNPYDAKNFKHISVDTLLNNAKLPDSFALGENTALFLYDTGNTSSALSLLNYDTLDFNTQLTVPNGSNFTDVVYQSGKYYVVAHENNSSSKIFVTDQNDVNFTLFAEIQGIYANCIEIDVSGKIYLYGEDDKIYTFNKASGLATELKADTNVFKLESDLAGNLFALADNNVVYTYINGVWDTVEFNSSAKFTSSQTDNQLKSFAMDYDKQTVYMIYENEELIVKTNALNNLAIDIIDLPDGYKISEPNATGELKTFKANLGANVYSVYVNGEKFAFNELVNKDTEYALICQFSQGGITFCALAGQDDVVLINTLDATETTLPPVTSVPNSVFVTTSVSGYYLPIITAGSEYTLTDGERIRLTSSQVIYPKHKISFLNKDYYFAEFMVGEKTYNGYIPTDYTVEILSQDFKWDSYTSEKVDETTVYKEKELVNALTQLADDESVRVISIEDDVAFIAFQTESGWINGYIDASSIQDAPGVAIRNILIIIAVMASVCGTTTFFILRKKK